jgi:hypothetical protein
MFAGIMDKVKAFVGWVWGMVMGFFSMVMALPKKALCWLHEKFCGC